MKAVEDSLNGLAYEDDRQVVSGYVDLFECSKEDQRVVVTLSTVVAHGSVEGS